MEIKISVSVVIPGRTMLSQQVAANKPENYDEFSMEVCNPNNKDRERILVKTRKCIPATQSLNISLEGYEAMTDENNCPYWSKVGAWKGINSKMRLTAHLNRICADLGGISYTYQVFEE